MLNNLKFLHSTTTPQLLQPPPSSPAPDIPKQFKFSRRELTICTNSSLLLLLGSQSLEPLSKAKADEIPPDDNQQGEENVSVATPNPDDNLQVEENVSVTTPNPDDNLRVEENVSVTTPNPDDNLQGEENVSVTTPNPDPCNNKVPTKRAFLDIAIDGEPVGRIVIGLYGNDVPVGAARFANIVSGAAGISYRRKEFVKIMPNYVQHGGLRSYGVDAELAKRTGSNLPDETLREEWERAYEKCPGVKNVAGTVSLVVRDPSKPPPKMKLVARKGKLEIDQEEIGIEPNGTEFVISIKDSPELDASALVIGQVLDGLEVVRRIGQVKTVQENTSSPYFRVAKLIGDKRAVVAERGFNRPYAKVVISNCGLMD